ncbi:MAG: 3-hydroxyacyl-ACP dehydratase FabZ [Candidatus Riflebacteria bacterium]|nr:3-hydroxyacyl-ACP dehydratase FabZ [Candidatus Riflebacteria bacterium]
MRFYLVDKITELDRGSSIKGFKNVSMTEPFFTYHFPRHPVMPGVLIIEALAQLAGLLIELSGAQGDYRKAILSIVDKTKFRHLVRPGDRIDMEARVENLAPNGASCRVRATVEGKELTETLLTFSLQDVSDRYDTFLEGERKALVETLLRDLGPDKVKGPA